MKSLKWLRWIAWALVLCILVFFVVQKFTTRVPHTFSFKAFPDLHRLPTDQIEWPAGFSAEAPRWKLVYFGFTQCPDICPTTLAWLSREIPETQPIDIWFISLDPDNDSPQLADSYAKSFAPRFWGAVSIETKLADLFKSMGFGTSAHDAHSVHRPELFLVDQKNHIVGFYSPPFNAEALRADLKQLSP